jgi:integrase
LGAGSRQATGFFGPPKGGVSREVKIEPTLVPLLEVLTAGRQPGDLLFPGFSKKRHMPRFLKTWLRLAGVTQAELHTKTPTTRPIRFHDLRATGITWRAVRDDPTFEIQYHAGHSQFSTTEKYLRLAAVVRAGFGEVFPVLPES